MCLVICDINHFAIFIHNIFSNGLAVPNVYPVDLFEHLWVADRLQRLGISRFFEAEIKERVDYVHRYIINMYYIYIHTHTNSKFDKNIFILNV